MDKALQQERGRYKPISFDRPMPDDNWPYHNHPNNGNDPQYGIKNPKFERHIFISRDSVIFAIDAQIQIVAEMRGEKGVEDSRLTNATTKYQKMFYGWIDKHIGIAKGKMQTFVLEKFKTSSMNTIKDKEETDIELLMPEWWDDTIFDQLCTAVNEYVVNAVLQEFFTVAFTSKDPVTTDKSQLAKDALDDIKKLSNSAKPGRIRKPYKPFG